jgi:Transposase IS66 family
MRPTLALQERGVKQRCRKDTKHLPSVKRFYRQISESNLQSERAAKVKERLEKNRDKLFTFLSYDGVPWNNNNAEHAVKPFAKLRHIIGGVTTEKGLRDYLVLLSLCQTCKYIGVDFLDFLRSGEKDIHAFADSRRVQRRRSGCGPLSRRQICRSLSDLNREVCHDHVRPAPRRGIAARS